MSRTVGEEQPASALVLALLLAAGITYSLSQTLILPALPQLREHLGTSTQTASWLLTGHLLSTAISTPLVGKLGDIHGRGRMLAIVSALFCVGSILSTTRSIELAILGRVLQGTAGGVFPLAYGVIRDTVPRERMMTAIGGLSVSLGIGSGFGPAISGVVVDEIGPSAVFWVGVVGALPALAAPWVIRDTHRERAKLDLVGATLLSAALLCLLLGLTNAGSRELLSPAVGGLIAMSMVLMGAWLRAEQRHPDPMIRIEILRDRTVALANGAAVCAGFGTFVTYSSIAPFVQAPEATGYGFGLSVSASGVLMLPHGILMMVCAPIAGMLCERAGSRPVLLGGTFFSMVASTMLVVLHGSPWLVLAASALLGAAHAFSLASLANLVVAAVRQEETGVATGINMVARTVGMALGGAIAAAILSAAIAASGVPSEAGYTFTFLSAALASLIAVFCALGIRPRAATATRDLPVHPPAPLPSAEPSL